MRPLRLDLDGFAVFREPTTVDFTDADPDRYVVVDAEGTEEQVGKRVQMAVRAVLVGRRSGLAPVEAGATREPSENKAAGETNGSVETKAAAETNGSVEAKEPQVQVETT